MRNYKGPKQYWVRKNKTARKAKDNEDHARLPQANRESMKSECRRSKILANDPNKGRHQDNRKY